MKPESDEARTDALAERAERDAIARTYREASDQVDQRPDPRVRAAVLAAAARAVDAKPRDAARTVATHPFAARRWPLSAAALVVVSIMTGLVVTRGWWERPDLVDASSQPRERAPETPQSPAQTTPALDASPAPDTSQAPVASESDVRSDPIAKPGTARREPVAKPNDARRLAAGVASPKADRMKTREAPAAPAFAPAPAPGIADTAASSAAPDKAAKKSEESSSNAAVAVASSSVASPAPAPVQRAASRMAETRAETRGYLHAYERAGSRADEEAERQAEATSPKAWIDRIVKLREAGEDDNADREVARFKLRYPNFTIPREALRAIGTR